MYGVLALVVNVAPAASQVGTVDYVPNGGFEYNSKPDNLLDPYFSRFGKYSLFWRQFHLWTVPNEVGTLPAWPINRDRVSDQIQMYQPVTCSSTDLFSEHLIDCVSGTPGSLLDIPNNWFGFETIRAGSLGQKYAGLYYRLNGIRPASGGGFEAFPGIPAKDWWREYLEVELLCELIEGRTYTLTFWASLAEVSERNINVEARVSQQPYHTHPLDDCNLVTDHDANQTSAVRPPVTDGPQGFTLVSNYLPKNGAPPNRGWAKVEGTFVASGGEKFLTIGYFGNNFQLDDTEDDDCTPHYNHRPLTTGRSYVYIDEVRLKSNGNVSCGCDGSILLEPIIPSPEEGKCCFRVLLSNGGDFGDPTCNACTIDSIIGRRNGNEQVILRWGSKVSHGPVPGDAIPREIGFICVDEFYYQPQFRYTFDLLGSDGQLLCQTSAWAFGCVDVCNSLDFGSSVSITPIISGNNPCCYRLKLDASILSGCAQIASIRVYKTNGQDRTEITSGAYNTTVPTNFSGFLYTFCQSSPLSFGLNESVSVEFKDASGDVICEVSLSKLTCVCACFSSSAEIHFMPVTGPNNSCCYDVVIRNPGDCKISVSEYLVLGSEFQWLNLTGSNGWSAGLSTIGTTTYGVKFTKSGPPGPLYPGQEMIIGRVCPGDCFVGDLSTRRGFVTYSINGVTCDPRNATSSSGGTCMDEIDCNDFIVSIIAQPVWNTSCCWYGVYAKVDVCPSEQLGLYVEASGHPQHPVTSNQTTLVAHWSCRPNSGGQTVKLKRADGTVLCTKSIGIPACSSAYNLKGSSESPDLGERAGYGYSDLGIRSIVVKRDSLLQDVELVAALDNWMVIDIDGIVVASSVREDTEAKNLFSVIGTLPNGEYVIHCTSSISGKAFMRRVYVQP